MKHTLGVLEAEGCDIILLLCSGTFEASNASRLGSSNRIAFGAGPDATSDEGRDGASPKIRTTN
jgi:hypothetical protein